ncbi:MAG: LLM class F420-dependent oxidoreductase [Spirochaetaceae bacterium]|nr:LLM class F420-dependent oxidoreductase [Myxococcales bacterium]MCB9724230.1 LLM class F420-dependent oxidoreductase [Spirochaetaceae bacterium]HPG24147.1 LLM class F420-dependent oxidoreductase [Myxococcota bacterium]
MKKLGYIPPMTKGLTDDRRYVIPFVEMLEEVGVESVWTVEHVIMATSYEPLYPYSDDGRAPTGPDTLMPDPLEWHAFAAARTEKINLGTAVVIASQHSAAILAKRVATLDALSGGRVRLGVGIGWQKEEYEAIGVPYRDRGRRLDETIEAMRVLWRDDVATYHGRHVRFENVHMDARPANGRSVPILIGGSSEHAARRAGRLGDGWYPYVISPDDFAKGVETIGRAAAEAGRDASRIELTIWPASYDFTKGFDLDFVRSYTDAGADRVITSNVESQTTDIGKQRDFIRRYQDEILAKL